MSRSSLHISGFPLNCDARTVKEFLENHTGAGTIFALKFRNPKNIRYNSRAYAIVQFTTRNSADSLLLKANSLGLTFEFYSLTVKPAYDIIPRPRVPLLEIADVTLSLGCPLSEERFSVLFARENVRLSLSRDMRKLVFFLTWREREYKLEYSYETIWEMRRHKNSLLLVVLGAPKIYTIPVLYTIDDMDDILFNFFKYPDDNQRWIRAVDFTDGLSIGQSSAVHLKLPVGSSLPDLSEFFAFIKDVDFALQLERGSPYSQDLELVPIIRPRNSGKPLPYDILFRVNILVQNGILSGPTLDDDFFKLVNPESVGWALVDRALDRLAYSKTCIFSPASWLHAQYEKLRKSKFIQTRGQAGLPPGLVHVHCAHITPTKVYFYGPEVNVSNRVIRQFVNHLENFMRVSFVDEEGERLRSVDLQPRQGSQTELYRRIRSTLRNGIAVGGKRFEFLAFSSSQLKDGSVWMFASSPNLSAADIRHWMGDFSRIRNVAKYAARLGQSFGSSTETLSVPRHEVEMIPDVEGPNGYVFSDGIGKISAPFAAQVAKKCELEWVPSAFQIRYGGCKGVVAVDPTSSFKLSLRKSMQKFESSNTKLDVLSYSKPQPCLLNRQLINLLSTLGVRDEVFEWKQREMVARLDETQTDPLKAQELLDAINPGEMAGILKKILSCGYKPDEEPFLSMMLRAFRKAKLNELRTRSRIFLPMGRSMMGCLDETRTLEYGQVFLRISSSLSAFNGSGFGGTRIVKGKVVVAKNPCLHPGDIRVLEAVDRPWLHHLTDCVVFPQKGHRPHPNECSGSDLDGDIYFVSWDPLLIPPCQVEPMDYTPAPQTILDRDVRMEDVEEYFANYLVNDSMGVIANAHTVFADREPEKAMSPQCLELARLFSIAVDFPKTGVPAVIPSLLIVKEFPDFMEKLDRETFKSKSVIGKLFNEVKDLCSDPDIEFTRRLAFRCYDRDMEIDGFENHLEEAEFYKGEYDFKLGNLIDHFGVKTEAEILFGWPSKAGKGFSSRKDYDSIRLAMNALKKEARDWFKIRKTGELEEDENYRLAKASAWYHVTYHPDYCGFYNEGLDRPHFLSFPWCIHEHLILIKERKKVDGLSALLGTVLT